MSNPILGKSPTAEDKRDAIHVAVVPVKASVSVHPGTHVGRFADGSFGVCDSPIGVVDPFLREAVPTGGMFWLCLYPSTVKNLRHDWDHAAFSEVIDRGPSVCWLTEFAAEVGVKYEVLMAGARAFVRAGDGPDGEATVDDDFHEHPDIDDEFWNHYEVASGVNVPPEKRGDFIGCCI